MTTKQLNTEIPAALDKDLSFFCIENGMKKKEVVEMALKQFLSKKAKKQIIEN